MPLNGRVIEEEAIRLWQHSNNPGKMKPEAVVGRVFHFLLYRFLSCCVPEALSSSVFLKEKTPRTAAGSGYSYSGTGLICIHSMKQRMQS